MTRLLLGKAFAACLVSAGLAVPPASAADLTVTVDGVQSAAGQLVLGLYIDAKTWPKGPADYTVEVPARQGRVVYVFKDLPPGRYALTGFHDENSDGTMNYSFIGLPKEGFFFSHDLSPGLSPPGFEACAVTLADTPMAITVRIQHWGRRL